MKLFLVLTIVFVTIGCMTTSKQPLEPQAFENTSTDPQYGYVPEKPIKLGGFMEDPRYRGRHHEYFEGLVGPNGEPVSIRRIGSCCAFTDDSLPFGGGLLDKYELNYEGLASPTQIYINLYQFERPLAPAGFALQ